MRCEIELEDDHLMKIYDLSIESSRSLKISKQKMKVYDHLGVKIHDRHGVYYCKDDRKDDRSVYDL